MEEVVVVEVPVAAKTVTVTARVVEEMTAVDMAGHWAVVLLFIGLGLCHKVMKEKRSFVVYLFSLWSSFRREIDRGTLGGSLEVFNFFTYGNAKEKPFVIAGKGKAFLLPEKRRRVLEELKSFEHIWEKKREAGIKLEATAVRLYFHAGRKELNGAEEEWKRLGELIEEENAALFTQSCWDGLKYFLFIEVVFSDEGRKAKSREAPYNPREDAEANKWFWLAIFPIFALSLFFIVHWAIWAMILVVALFLYKRDLEREEQIRKVIDNDPPLSTS